MGVQYYYDGADARRIRSVTRNAVLEVLREILLEADYEIGEDDGELPLFKSGKAAESRYQRAEPFVYLAQNKTKGEPKNVLGHDDGLTHSGVKYEWSFVLQASAGKQSGETTDEQISIADDELMDVILTGFRERYAYFRDTLHFMEMNIVPSDEAREGGGLNPLALTFYNYTRLATDQFGYVAAI
jgi:hypothetical protein